MSKQEMGLLLEILAGRNLKGTHLEIGTAAGGTLCRLIQFYREEFSEPPGFMVIDPFEYFPSQFDATCENLSNHGIDHGVVQFHKTTSSQAFRETLSAPPALDFILIDGNHKVRHVTEDLRWTRYLDTKGLVCVHDYSPAQLGVLLSVDRFLAKNPNYRKVSQEGRLLIMEKCEGSLTEEITFSDNLWACLLSPWLQLRLSFKKRLKRLGLLKN